MNITWIIIGAISIILLAFLIGAGAGSAEDKEDKVNQTGAINFMRYKNVTSVSGRIKWMQNVAKITGKKAPLPSEENQDSVAVIQQIATDIYKAKGDRVGGGSDYAVQIQDDDETLLYSALSRLKSVAELVRVNNGFQVLKKQNVIDFIYEFLDEEELTKAYGILQSLPAWVYKNGTKVMQPKNQTL